MQRRSEDRKLNQEISKHDPVDRSVKPICTIVQHCGYGTQYAYTVAKRHFSYYSLS